MAGGHRRLLAGLFPALEADAVQRPVAVVALVPAWILRDMGLWLRGRAVRAAWRAFWDGAIVAGSWGLALSWGSVFSDVLLGPDGRDRPRGDARPCGGRVVRHARAAFAALRLRGVLRERARCCPAAPARAAPTP